MDPFGCEIRTNRDLANFTSFQHYETVGNFPGQNRVVRGNENRGEFLDTRNEVVLRLEIEPQGRFIEDIGRSFLYQGAGKGESLFLSTREVLGQPVSRFPQTKRGQQL